MDYDITILGGGSAGLTAARVATSLGARTLLIDKERLGGDCLYSGCVPSKSLIHIARLVYEQRKATAYDPSASTRDVDMAKIVSSLQGIITRIHAREDVYVKDATTRFGTVTFQSPTTLKLDNETITSRTTLIATGSRPAVPTTIHGLADVAYLTNEDIFQLTALPESLIIIGGGPVGVEMGQALTRLGVRVTLLQRAERLLPKEDVQVSETIATVLQSEGVVLALNTRAVKVRQIGDKKEVIATTQGGKQVTLQGNALLLAVGRQPNVERLNLEAAGVAYTSQGITVDDTLQTTASNIFALGDVIGGYHFTHVAAYQAGIAVRNALLSVSRQKVMYRAVPWCIFTDPELAHVGLTPEQAQQQYARSRAVVLPWADIDRAQTMQTTTGFIKLVLAGKKDEIVGAHLIGTNAGELLGELTLAIQRRLTVSDLLAVIHPYPTMSTGIQQAVFEAYLTGKQARTNRTFVQAAMRIGQWAGRFRTNRHGKKSDDAKKAGEGSKKQSELHAR